MSRIVSLLSWLEDCSNLFVKLVCNPSGIGFPDEESPETRAHSVQEVIRVGQIAQILSEHPNDNIWRSWQLFSDEMCLVAVSCVPVFIDIDNEEHDLQGAYDLSQKCLNWFEGTNQYPAPDRLRVVFSRRKGFHIEGRPTEPVNNQSIREALLRGLTDMGLEHRDTSNRFPIGTIDPTSHDFIRLTGSLNSWIEDHKLKSRRVFQLSLEDFRELNLGTILEKAEAV